MGFGVSEWVVLKLCLPTLSVPRASDCSNTGFNPRFAGKHFGSDLATINCFDLWDRVCERGKVALIWAICELSWSWDLMRMSVVWLRVCAQLQDLLRNAVLLLRSARKTALIF